MNNKSNFIVRLFDNYCSLLFDMKHMISSAHMTNFKIIAFIAVLAFKLLTRKILFINRKDNRNC